MKTLLAEEINFKITLESALESEKCMNWGTVSLYLDVEN